MINLEQLDSTVDKISELAGELGAGVHPNGNEELQVQVREVARARVMYKAAAEAKNVAMAQWEEEHAELIGEVIRLSEIKEEHEARLRIMTLEVYGRTGNKKPCEGVSVKLFKKLAYDSREAFEWAKKSGLALKLDIPNFEKHAQIENLSFVEITEEPRAQIAQELKEE